MSDSSGRTENLSNLALFKNLLKIINFTRKKIQKCLSKFISQVLALTRELLFYNLWNIDVIIFYTHNFEQIHVNSVIRFWNITQTCMSGGSAKRSNLEIFKKLLLCYARASRPNVGLSKLISQVLALIQEHYYFSNLYNYDVIIFYTQFWTNLPNVMFIPWSVFEINPAKKETPHSFKGHQLENKLLYRLVIYIGLWVTFLALIWHQICNKKP